MAIPLPIKRLAVQVKHSHSFVFAASQQLRRHSKWMIVKQLQVLLAACLPPQKIRRTDPTDLTHEVARQALHHGV